jgi:hypothetical protein
MGATSGAGNAYPSRQYNGQKIPKGKSESINKRRIDNTMAKRKKDKQRTTKHYTENKTSSKTNPIVLSILLLFMDSDYPFGIFWPLYCLFFFYLWILITPLVSSNPSW